jgi:hypothetical protein
MATGKSNKPALVAAPHPCLTLTNAEELERKLRHLSAALFLVSGAGQQAFDELDPETQQDYLNLCTDTAMAAQQMAARMIESAEAVNG